VLCFFRRSVDVDEERGADVERPVDAGRFDDRFDCKFVHHLDRSRNDPGAHDPRDARRGFGRRREGRKERARRFGRAQDANPRLGDDSDEALAAHESRHEIVADRIGRRRAKSHDLAVGGNDRRGRHMIGRETVLEAMRAAGVFGDVAADRADAL
jgi:hypothetical protein